MGCDIHLFVEVKTENGWELYSSPNIQRNYSLFAKLANVRNYGNIVPISEPKGLPEDVSFLVRKEREDFDTDGHSDSWIGIEEIKTLEDWIREYRPYGDVFDCISLEYSILHSYLYGNPFSCAGTEEGPEWVKDVRFVFWFDN